MITVLAQNRLNLEDLKNIPVVRPERAGSRWQGIPHHDLAVTIHRELLDRGIGISGQLFGVDASKQTMVAGYSIEFPGELGIPRIDGQTYSLAVQNNNAMKYALTFAVGTVVLVCENGVVTGDFVVKRKHTIGLDLSEVVSAGIDRFVSEARQVEHALQSLKERRLSRRQSDHLLMEAGRKKLLPFSLVGQVEREYQHPTHMEFAERTGWGLLNAWNHVAKKLNPSRQISSIGGFRRMLLNGSRSAPSHQPASTNKEAEP